MAWNSSNKQLILGDSPSISVFSVHKEKNILILWTQCTRVVKKVKMKSTSFQIPFHLDVSIWDFIHHDG